MTKYCPICGTPMNETTWGRYHCPNHGIINGDEEHPEEENGKERRELSYVG